VALGKLRQRGRRRVWFGLALLALVLVLVPSAWASSRLYFSQHNLGANTAVTDGVNHNHNFNILYFGPNATYPSGIYEVTANTGETHFAKNGNGNISITHSPTYFDHPFCWNRDFTAHFVSYCEAEW
jgi:hypothetical protein